MFKVWYYDETKLNIYDIYFAAMILGNMKIMVSLWVNFFMKSMTSCEQTFIRISDLLKDGEEVNFPIVNNE